MRHTKSYSFDDRDMDWIRRLERDAKTGRTTGIKTSASKHLIHVIKYYLDHQRILKSITKGAKNAGEIRPSHTEV